MKAIQFMVNAPLAELDFLAKNCTLEAQLHVALIVLMSSGSSGADFWLCQLLGDPGGVRAISYPSGLSLLADLFKEKEKLQDTMVFTNNMGVFGCPARLQRS